MYCLYALTVLLWYSSVTSFEYKILLYFTDRVSTDGNAVCNVRLECQKSRVCPPVCFLNRVTIDLDVLHVCGSLMTIARLGMKVKVKGQIEVGATLSE